MKLWRSLRLLAGYDARTLLLLIEAWLTLGYARLLLLVPFERVARSLGNEAQTTPPEHDASDTRTIKHIASVVSIASRFTPWDSKCLVRAIAGMRMLARRRISSTMYLGTARDESGRLEAHAWLRSGSLYITGHDVMHRFVVVQTFARWPANN